MTEILDLATSIADTKENIRTTIVARGIACGTDVKFADYPGKISQIARDPAFMARNDLGVETIAAGTKVLVQPLEQTAGLQVKFSNALQKQNWASLRLYPYSTTRLMCDTAKYYGGCGLYSWTSEGGLGEIYSTTVGADDYGDQLYRRGLIFKSPTLVESLNLNQNDISQTQYHWTPSGVITAENQYDHILTNGYGVKSTNTGNWTLWTINTETGAFVSQVGQCVSNSAISYQNNIYVVPGGMYIIYTNGSCSVFKNEDGAITQIKDSVSDLNTIVASKQYHQVLGGTSDGKYMIVNRYTDTADGKGTRNFPAIIEIGNNCESFTEYTDLAIDGMPCWYPWLNTLTVKNGAGVVRMFKYSNGTWTEIGLDITTTFTSGCDNSVTLNYDGSQICVTDATAYDKGNVYLYNLAVEPNGYKAIPDSPHNYNTKCYTAFATGNMGTIVNAGVSLVEVNALLPSLDNTEYTPEKFFPIIKPTGE